MTRGGHDGALVFRDTSAEVKITRWVATLAGLLGFVLSVLTPLLPVVQTTATLNWPQGGQLNNVTAPLISLTPVSMTASVPCEVIRAMPPKGGMVLGLAPQKGKDAALNSLFRDRKHRAGGRHRSQRGDRQRAAFGHGRLPTHRDQFVRGRNLRQLHRITAEYPGLRPRQGFGPDRLRGPARSFKDPNLRPGIVGVFTDLTGPAPAGLNVSAVIDTRFTTRPTTLKLAAMLLAIAATAVALAALWRLDRLDGRRMHKLIPQRWRTFTAVDATVVTSFVVWYVLGANSSDDGYILGMAGWPTGPATCRTTSAGSAARRIPSAGTTTCWR